MFSASDIYTTTGSTTLWGCFNPNIPKFDSSSFYNWEQDNGPLYTIEEDLRLLWEKGGFSPSAGVDGIVLVVSADAPASLVACNGNVFTSVSAAVRALPTELRFPVVIEVASFGNLGNLELNNISFTERGSLEIINRNFGKAYSSSSTVILNSTYAEKKAVNSTSYPQYQYAETIFSPDLSSTFANASAVSISATVFSAGIYADTRPQTRGTTAFFSTPGATNGGRFYDRVHAAISDTSFFVTGNGYFDYNVFEQSNGSEVTPFDASSTNLITNTELYPESDSITSFVGLVYNNYLTSAKIYNCNGPIYLRGFVSQGGLLRETGFDIQNSTLFLENCAASRFTKAGFNIQNSNVTVLRGIVAYRNYGVSTLGSGATRLTGNWTSFYKDDKLEELDSAAGLKARNSYLNFSSTVAFENTTQQATNVSGKDFYIAFSRNYNGIDIKDCIINGGIARPRTSSLAFGALKNQTFFTADNNVNTGMIFENSVIDIDGRIISQNNKRGIKSINSNIAIDSLWLKYNQIIGLDAKNSTIFYNKGYPDVDDLIEEEVPILSYFNYCIENGQHIKLDASKFDIKQVSGLDTKIGTFYLGSTFGANVFSTTTSGIVKKSMIEADNGSYIKLAGTYLTPGAASILSDRPETFMHAKNGSKVHIQGSKRRPTAIVANVQSNESKRKFITALKASKNSEIEINGPTLIFNGVGVGAMVTDNSVLHIRPPQLESGAFDVSGWTLSNTGNHTTVEIQAHRSCLVADKNSTINLENLGAYTELWARGNLGLSALASGTDFTISETSAYTKRGALQFYPRINYAAAASVIGDPAGDGPEDGVTIPESFYHVNGGSTGDFNYWLGNGNSFNAANQALLSSITDGGWAVRALNNSVVNVKNVHFPTGWWNASATVYDISGEIAGNILCNRTFLWQVAGNSRLHANYVSVSGLYPEDADYYGPGSVWLSGASQVAYGAPAGTPDTSSLSVRDYFGPIATNAWPLPGGGFRDIGYSTPKNRGPFRLYVSTDAAADNLTFVNSPNNYGYIPQVFAQGYNFSGNASSIASTSSLYLGMTKFSGSNLVTSGFYYCSSFVDSNGDNILLDESAANIFANAKNGAAARSGRPKICTIYRPYTTPPGGNSSDYKQWGKGILSINTFDIEKDN